MELNKYEQYFVEIHHYLNKIGLSHWLIGSSLLGPLRDSHFIEGDREINFGVMADDLGKFISEMSRKYRVVLSPNLSRTSGVYLLNKDSISDELGDHPDPFTWLAPHYISGDKVIQCVNKSHLLYWEKNYLLPLINYKYLDDVFCVPHHPERWLESYYGKGWVKRDPNWSWLNNANNHINLEDLC
jgi:hypothetical protein